MILTWAILIALLLGSLVFIARPIAGRRQLARREEERRAALIEREITLQLLRDLQHDHLTEKIDDADFAAQKEAVESRAIEAMKRLDALGHSEGGDPLEAAVRRERMRLLRGTR